MRFRVARLPHTVAAHHQCAQAAPAEYGGRVLGQLLVQPFDEAVLPLLFHTAQGELRLRLREVCASGAKFLVELADLLAVDGALDRVHSLDL